MDVVSKTLQELNAFDKPIITIFNKMNVYEQKTFDTWLEEQYKEGNAG